MNDNEAEIERLYKRIAELEREEKKRKEAEYALFREHLVRCSKIVADWPIWKKKS